MNFKLTLRSKTNFNTFKTWSKSTYLNVKLITLFYPWMNSSKSSTKSKFPLKFNNSINYISTPLIKDSKKYLIPKRNLLQWLTSKDTKSISKPSLNGFMIKFNNPKSKLLNSSPKKRQELKANIIHPTKINSLTNSPLLLDLTLKNYSKNSKHLSKFSNRWKPKDKAADLFLSIKMKMTNFKYLTLTFPSTLNFTFSTITLANSE